MNIRLLILVVGGLLQGIVSQGQNSIDSIYNSEYLFVEIENPDTLKISPPSTETVQIHESKRLVASVLCLTLGPFGMHRLYLGTTPAVAAAYSVTLGAIGILPVVDFLLITFSKDISRFKNNDKVIMWKR